MKTKSLGELLSDALCKASGVVDSWSELNREEKKFLNKAAPIFVRSLPASAYVIEMTSPAVATKAAKALRSKHTSKAGKSIAASALTQTRNRRGGRK